MCFEKFTWNNYFSFRREKETIEWSCKFFSDDGTVKEREEETDFNIVTQFRSFLLVRPLSLSVSRVCPTEDTYQFVISLSTCFIFASPRLAQTRLADAFQGFSGVKYESVAVVLEEEATPPDDCSTTLGWYWSFLPSIERFVLVDGDGGALSMLQIINYRCNCLSAIEASRELFCLLVIGSRMLMYLSVLVHRITRNDKHTCTRGEHSVERCHEREQHNKLSRYRIR